MTETVKLHYSAPGNITFHGEIDTGITHEEWAEMSGEERDEVVTEELFALVDIGAEEIKETK